MLKKTLAGLIGLSLLGQTYIADCASRRELNIPDNGYIIRKERCGENVFCIEYDNGIGEAYRILSDYGNGKVLRKINPFGLWYDRNNSGKAEDDELYFSPRENEDWEPYKKDIKI